MGSHCFTLSDAELTEYLQTHADLRETQHAYAVQLATAVTNVGRLCEELNRVRDEQAKLRDEQVKLRDELHAQETRITEKLHEIDTLLARYIGIGVGVSGVVSFVIGAVVSYAISILT